MHCHCSSSSTETCLFRRSVKDLCRSPVNVPACPSVLLVGTACSPEHSRPRQKVCTVTRGLTDQHLWAGIESHRPPSHRATTTTTPTDNRRRVAKPIIKPRMHAADLHLWRKGRHDADTDLPLRRNQTNYPPRDDKSSSFPASISTCGHSLPGHSAVTRSPHSENN